MPEHVTSGQDLIVSINGRTVGRLQSISWTRRSTLRRVQGVDTLYASELIRGPVQVAGTLGLVKVRRDGGAVGAGLLVPDPDLSQEQYVTLVLRDRTTGTLIVRIEQCLVDSEGWRGEVKNIMTAQVSFEGIRVTGEVSSNRR